MEQELTEYGALQVAITRLENQPTVYQRIMAIVPMFIIMVCSTVILYYSYTAQGNTDAEKWAPNIATILSIVMLICEVLMIAYRHHEKYEMIRTMAEIMLRVNIIHLIICGSCVSYIKTSGTYSTYFILVFLTTIPIYILSISPVMCGIYS
jgi:cytochrome bd-type quinol oxidase subunit 2